MQYLFWDALQDEGFRFKVGALHGDNYSYRVGGQKFIKLLEGSSFADLIILVSTLGILVRSKPAAVINAPGLTNQD